jgi:hypothetical protein
LAAKRTERQFYAKELSPLIVTKNSFSDR